MKIDLRLSNLYYVQALFIFEQVFQRELSLITLNFSDVKLSKATLYLRCGSTNTSHKKSKKKQKEEEDEEEREEEAREVRG